MYEKEKNPMKKIQIEPLTNFNIKKIVENLPNGGMIKIINDNFVYLDIDDNFIHHIFPVLANEQVKKPDYFSSDKNFIGAHISLIYPEEQAIINQQDTNSFFQFEIEGLFRAYLLEKRYYVLKVKSSELLKYRTHYGLSDKLLLKGYLVDLHITVAIDALEV